jgi:hypothetical protein
MFDLACEMTAKLAPKYSNTSDHIKFFIDKDYYETLYEEYLDTIFEEETRLEQEDWIDSVAEKYNYIFKPNEIRKKIGVS